MIYTSWFLRGLHLILDKCAKIRDTSRYIPLHHPGRGWFLNTLTHYGTIMIISYNISDTDVKSYGSSYELAQE